jgi:STE24 endopeptidase
MPLHLLAAGCVSVITVPFVNAVSRSNERSADRFAIQVTGRKWSFISAMKRLGAQNLAEQRPSLVTRWLFYTHPPLHERIAAASSAINGADS